MSYHGPLARADSTALGRALRQLRRREGLTQEALARRAGSHRNYVGAVEQGQQNPTFAVLLRLADALGVTPSELMRVFEERRATGG